MRLVLDTNVVVAGLLWSGHPRHLLGLVIDEAATLFSSPALLDELTRTLHYPKFAKRIEQFGTTPPALVVHYSALVTLLSPTRCLAWSRTMPTMIRCSLAPSPLRQT